MDEKIHKLIEDIKSGQLDAESAARMIRKSAYEDMSYAKIDHDRSSRKGFPEVIFGQSKTSQQILEIALRIIDVSGRVLVTRITGEKYAEIKESLPEHRFNDTAGVLHAGKEPVEKDVVGVPVITAGTGDLQVAEEAAETLRALGHPVVRMYDVGVAGIHRFFDQLDRISESKVVVVAAGMDGVLPSVVGGLVKQPVIAVPTSCGYGTCFGGIGPLITMLNSCAPGVLVVNIDNGFGAGYAAAMINGS